MRWVYNKYKGKNTIYYLQSPMALDIETSWNHNDLEPITWISSIQCFFNDELKIFRKPSDFLLYIEEIYNFYELDDKHRLMIIVHNLSFDISYLMPFLQCSFKYGVDDIHILNKGHKITCYTQGGLEFRDTFALTQKSLARWGKDMNVEHQKQEGLYDYDKIIYQDTELSAEEIKYDSYDVYCLYEAFKKQLNLEDDTIATIPYTATGYVRRRFRVPAIRNKEYMNDFRKWKLNEEYFLICISSFAGGYVHNNRLLKSMLIDFIIGHRDFRSHYPSQLRVNMLPYGEPITVYDPKARSRDKNNKWSIDTILSLSPEYFTISTIWITEAKLKSDNITMPFMQFSKMRDVKPGSKHILDNGRVMSFIGGCIMHIDNYLLEILRDQYNLKGYIVKVIAFKQQYTPKCLADTIDYYFKAKTDEKIKLKQIVKEYGEFSDEAFLQRAILQHAKAGLNGCYGMFVQNPIHEEYDINFRSDDRPLEDIYNPILSGKTVQQSLDAYYKNRNSFLPYQVGVAVTALARYELYQYIVTIGYENILYADTDSIFYRKTEEIERKIEDLNRLKQMNAEKLGAYITSSEGEKIYYDVFEKEDDCKAFRGLHSKCYGIVTSEKGHDILQATIAGVPARTAVGLKDGKVIYLTREEELTGITAADKLLDPDKEVDTSKAINNIKDNFIFKVNTGTAAYYLNKRPYTTIVNGHEIETAGGCIIKRLEEKTISDIMVSKYLYEDLGEVENE